MNQNMFYKRYQEKTDSELEQILHAKQKYTEPAINAARQIIEERNGQKPELETIKKEIEQTVQEKVILQQNDKEKKKGNYLTDDPNAPELHSKRVIYVFATLFSTIFGAVLLMYNMKQTGNRKGRIQVLIFGVLYTIIIILIINQLNINENLALLFNMIGASILILFFWDKFIGKEFKYRKRSWIKPAIISTIIIILFILSLFFAV